MEPGSWAGGVAAILAAVTLLVGIAGMATRSDRGRPCLVVLFGINAGYGDVSPDTFAGSNRSMSCCFSLPG
jgi:hypothetical protein